MYFWDSNVKIVESEIAGNSARVGGGIYAGDWPGAADITIIDCTISANAASAGGGGIYAYGRVIIMDSTISWNAAGSGGGMWCDGVGGITNCVISGNSARGSGGGFYFTFSRPTIANSAIIGNKATRGGGIFFDFVGATITNCTTNGNDDDGMSASSRCGRAPADLGDGDNGGLRPRGRYPFARRCGGRGHRLSRSRHRALRAGGQNH